MSRSKGTKNKLLTEPAEVFCYTTEQRITLIADLIVERIIEDQRHGHSLLKLLEMKRAS